MGTVWEYQWEYTDLDDGQTKTFPYWLTEAEAQRMPPLVENGARRLFKTRRERTGPPEWLALTRTKRTGYKTLPAFDSPNDTDLRELWRRIPDPDVHRAILEIVRVRRIFKEANDLCQKIRSAWAHEVGGTLVAVEVLRVMIGNESQRYSDRD